MKLRKEERKEGKKMEGIDYFEERMQESYLNKKFFILTFLPDDEK